MVKRVSATIRLTGALEGRSVVLNHYPFVDGILRFTGTEEEVAGLSRYMSNCYSAVAEVNDGQRDVQATPERGGAEQVQRDVRPSGEEPPPPADRDVGGADVPEAAGGGDLPSGGGPENPRVPQDPQVAKIRAAIMSLDPADPTHWTGSGLPSISAVEAKLGSGGVNRGMINRAASDLTREMVASKG